MRDRGEQGEEGNMVIGAEGHMGIGERGEEGHRTRPWLERYV